MYSSSSHVPMFFKARIRARQVCAVVGENWSGLYFVLANETDIQPPSLLLVDA